MEGHATKSPTYPVWEGSVIENWGIFSVYSLLMFAGNILFSLWLETVCYGNLLNILQVADSCHPCIKKKN